MSNRELKILQQITTLPGPQLLMKMLSTELKVMADRLIWKRLLQTEKLTLLKSFVTVFVLIVQSRGRNISMLIGISRMDVCTIMDAVHRKSRKNCKDWKLRLQVSQRSFHQRQKTQIELPNHLQSPLTPS